MAIHLSACLASVIDLIRIMLFLPYKDDNPTRSTPWVNWLLIITNVWVFFSLQFPLDANQQMAYFSNFGFIPATFFGQFFYPSVKGIMWEWYSVISSMFSHGGIAHLFGNMLFLYLYGDNLEDCMGKFRYLIFYLGCGLLAALAQAFLNPASQIPMVGASGCHFRCNWWISSPFSQSQYKGILLDIDLYRNDNGSSLFGTGYLATGTGSAFS